MNTYFLCLTQYENVGDLLINKMLIEEFSRYGTVYIDCPDAPSDFKRYIFDNPNVINVNSEYKVSIKYFNLFKLITFLKRKNICLFSKSPGPIRISQKKVSSLYIKFIYFLISKLGISYYRIGNCCSNIMAKRLSIHFNNIKSVYVRSINTVEYLKSIGNDNVFYIPDLAYLYHYWVKHCEKKKIAILSFREILDSNEQFLVWLKATIAVLKDKGYGVEMYYQVKTDEAFMRYLYDEINDDSIIFRNELVWFDSFGFYNDKAIVISNRLHSLLLGAVHGVIPLSYEDGNTLTSKIRDVFYSSLTNPEQYITTSFSQKLAVHHILENIDECQQSIRLSCEYNANLCRNIIKQVALETECL